MPTVKMLTLDSKTGHILLIGAEYDAGAVRWSLILSRFCRLESKAGGLAAGAFEIRLQRRIDSL
jgi:hypothetical protein